MRMMASIIDDCDTVIGRGGVLTRRVRLHTFYIHGSALLRGARRVWHDAVYQLLTFCV